VPFYFPFIEIKTSQYSWANEAGILINETSKIAAKIKNPFVKKYTPDLFIEFTSREFFLTKTELNDRRCVAIIAVIRITSRDRLLDEF